MCEFGFFRSIFVYSVLFVIRNPLDTNMPKIKVKVLPDLCIGAAACVTVAPETFQLNEENKADVLDHGQAPGGASYEREMEVTEEELQNILLSAESCPVLAVHVFDENGKQLFPKN